MIDAIAFLIPVLVILSASLAFAATHSEEISHSDNGLNKIDQYGIFVILMTLILSVVFIVGRFFGY